MKKEITVTRGTNGAWFVRMDGVLESGFQNRDDADIYVKAKYPDPVENNPHKT